MPRRRKKAAVFAGTTLKIVPVDANAFASASVKFSSARTYDEKLLGLTYPDGDLSKVAVMRLVSRPDTTPADTELSYFAYACGLLSEFDDLLLLRDDPSGEQLEQMLSCDATLLFDECQVRDEHIAKLNARRPDVEPVIDAAGFVYEHLWHPLPWGRSQALWKLSYIGNLPKNTAYALAYAEIAEELNTNMRKFSREAFSISELPHAERTCIIAHMPQIVVPASFGKFSDFEEKAVSRIMRISADDIALAREVASAFAEDALSKEPSYADARNHLSRISGTFDIWTRMLDEIKRNGKTDEIRAEAQRLKVEDEEFAQFAETVFAKVPSLARNAFSWIAAIGMASGVDLVLDAYYAGASIESLFPEASGNKPR